MFAKSITLATAFAILAHTVLGCCAHHAHAGPDECGSAGCASAGTVENGADNTATTGNNPHKTKCGHSHTLQPEDSHQEVSRVQYCCDASPSEGEQEGEGEPEGQPQQPVALALHPVHDHDFCDDGDCQYFLTSITQRILPVEESFTGTVYDLYAAVSACLLVNATSVTLNERLASLRSPQMHQIWLI